LFLTDSYCSLSRREKHAVLYHEVRGHWELRLTDKQMLAVLCPGAAVDDTHCISLAIMRGCPSLRGRTTEEVYRIAFDAGPFIRD